MSSRAQLLLGTIGDVVPGQQEWTTPGTYSFKVPYNVTRICGVCVGAGSGAKSAYISATGGGGGGALAYTNGVIVTPNETLTVIVGAGASQASGEDSAIKRSSTILIRGAGAVYAANGTTGMAGGDAAGCVGDVKISGSAGGNATTTGGYKGGGGGGAAGYSSSPTEGKGGTGGQGSSATECGGGGGGVGLKGIGSNGSTGANGTGGGGGSGGASGATGTNSGGGAGGLCGGGAGGNADNNTSITFSDNSGNGGVRIIWGSGRSYPSNAADV